MKTKTGGARVSGMELAVGCIALWAAGCGGPQTPDTQIDAASANALTSAAVTGSAVASASSAPPAGLPADQVQAGVRAIFPRLRSCYETGLANTPALAGKATFAFTISPGGSVDSASLVPGGTLADTLTTNCLSEAFKTASFPASPGPTKVQYPLDFSPGDPPAVDKGGLAAPEIQKVVRAGFDTIRKCYEAGLKKDPAMSGKITVKFTIDPKGAANNPVATPDSTIKSPEVTGCVVDSFKALAFPRAKTKTDVSYPLAFSP